MAYSDHYNMAQDAVFIGRVQVATMKAAIAVANELDTTPMHTERVKLAITAFANPQNTAFRMAQGVITNGTIATAIDAQGITPDPLTAGTDGDIEFVVNSIWNAYATEQL